MTDSIKFSENGTAMDSYGNVSTSSGLACAKGNEIIPSSLLKEVTHGNDVIGAVQALARAASPDRHYEGAEISLGELQSPLQAICDQYQQLKSRFPR